MPELSKDMVIGQPFSTYSDSKLETKKYSDCIHKGSDHLYYASKIEKWLADTPSCYCFLNELEVY